MQGPAGKIFSGIVLMAMFGFVVAVLGLEVAADLAMDHEGKTSYGRVLRKFESFHTRRYRTSTSYVVEYRFRDDKGRDIIGTDAVEKSDYVRFRTGQGVDITYLPDYSEIHRIGPAPDYGLRSTILAGVFVLFGLAFYMVLTAFR